MESVKKAIQNLQNDGDDSLAKMLQEKARQHLKAAQENKETKNETALLVQVLAALKAKIEWSKFAHWTSQGEEFYGDHLLYDRIYEESAPDFDACIEKFLIQWPEEIANPIQTLKEAQQTLEKHQTESYLNTLMELSQHLLTQIKELYDALKTQEKLSLGLDDFIMTLADHHENHLYLLKQRLK